MENLQKGLQFLFESPTTEILLYDCSSFVKQCSSWSGLLGLIASTVLRATSYEDLKFPRTSSKFSEDIFTSAGERLLSKPFSWLLFF